MASPKGSGDGTLVPSRFTPEAAFPGENGRIVFARDFDGTADDGIYSVNPDGTDLTRLVANSPFPSPFSAANPQVSADGTRIVFAEVHSAEIYVMNADGSGLTQVGARTVSRRQPALSPDGSKIVFAGDDGEVYIMDADGTNETRLTDTPDSEYFPVFSPDGSRIAFLRTTEFMNGGSELHVMDADGTNDTSLPVPVLSGGVLPSHRPAFSPDGSKIAFNSQDGRDVIYTIDTDGTDLTLVSGEATAHHLYPSFSPDGTKIVFLRQNVLSQESEENGLYVINADGTDLTQLTVGDSWSGDHGDPRPDWGPVEGTVVEDDLFVEDCEDPFLDQVTEVLGNLIILDPDCDVAVSLDHIRVGGEIFTSVGGEVVQVNGEMIAVVDDTAVTVDLGGVTQVNGEEIAIVDDTAVTVDLGGVTQVNAEMIAVVDDTAVTVDLGGVTQVNDETAGAHVGVTGNSASGKVTSGDDTIVEVDTDEPPL